MNGSIWQPSGNVPQTIDSSVVADTTNPGLWSNIRAFIQYLASSSGSSIVGTIQAGAGAIASTTQTELRRTVFAGQYGAAGDGTTNDSAAIFNACNALGVGGGTVMLTGRHLIDTTLTVPHNVTIDGRFGQLGTSLNNTTKPYATLSYSLIVNSAATISLSGGAGLRGCLVYRKGQAFPETNPAVNFAGTAITQAGDDAFVINSMVLGFAQAFYSTGFQRTYIDNLKFDCTAGIWIDNAADIPKVQNCHGWPFTTVNTAVTSQRSGSAYKLSNTVDWARWTNCFAYDYFRGFNQTAVNDTVYLNCAVDGAGGYAGQIGFASDGNSLRPRYIGCNISSQDTGAYIDNSTGGQYNQAQFLDCNITTCTSRAIQINSGDAKILGGNISNLPTGILVGSGSSRVTIDFVRFANISAQPINTNIGNTNVYIGEHNDFGAFTGQVDSTNNALPTIATASPLVIPNTRNAFGLSGTTGFSIINSGWSERKITLIFGGTTTVTSSGSANGVQVQGGTFNAVAGSTLTLIHNGANWFEIARKT